MKNSNKLRLRVIIIGSYSLMFLYMDRLKLPAKAQMILVALSVLVQLCSELLEVSKLEENR